MKYSFLLFAIFWFSAQLFAQKEKQHAQIFLTKGEVVESEINANFLNKKSLKYTYNGKRRSTHIKKVDSLFTSGETYQPKLLGLSYHWVKKVDQGQINLFELNNHLLFQVGADLKDYFVLPAKNYGRTYSFLCLDSLSEEKDNITKEEFVVLVREFNQEVLYSGSNRPVMFDSLRTSIKPVMLGISIYRPEVNLELKFTNRVSLVNGYGMNFFGDTFRNARTFVNSDYSAQLRFYHGYGRRTKRGQSVYNNTGSYLSLNYTYLIENGVDNLGFVNIAWGVQGKSPFVRGYSNSRFGLGYHPQSGNIMFTSILNLGLAR